MKKLLLFLSSICIILLFCQCPCLLDTEYMLYFYNSTSDTVSVYLALGDQTAYPDTSLPADHNRASIGGAAPYTTGLVWISGVSHEKAIKDLPRDTLSFLLLHDDTIKKYKWQEIRDDYKILKRYDLSFEDIQMLNFTIHYPPTEAMKNMKMYPPYGENKE